MLNVYTFKYKRRSMYMNKIHILYYTYIILYTYMGRSGRKCWRNTPQGHIWGAPVNSDEHKKCHNFWSRWSFFAPKSLLSSLRYIWRRLQCCIDVDSCISIAIWLFCIFLLFQVIILLKGTYELSSLRYIWRHQSIA